MQNATRILAAGVALLFCTSTYAQTGSLEQSSANKSNSASVSYPIIVALEKPLDSKKLKPGTEVEAKTLNEWHAGGMTIQRYSRVIGHVAEAKARSKGDAESTLTIAFDQLIRPGSAATPLKVAILALAPDPNQTDAGGHVDYTDRDALAYRPTVPGPEAEAVPLLNEQSRGVLGLKNLQLTSEGVLVSSGKELKLESGTRMLLAVEP